MFLTLIVLAVTPQSLIIIGLIMGYFLMILFLTTKYTIVKMTY